MCCVSRRRARRNGSDTAFGQQRVEDDQQVEVGKSHQSPLRAHMADTRRLAKGRRERVWDMKAGLVRDEERALSCRAWEAARRPGPGTFCLVCDGNSAGDHFRPRLRGSGPRRAMIFEDIHLKGQYRRDMD